MLLKVAADRKPFRLSELDGVRVVEPAQTDLRILDSLRRGDDDVNPQLVSKARQSVPALFSNWEHGWPKSAGSWKRPGLRLCVSQSIEENIRTGQQQITQRWLIAAENN